MFADTHFYTGTYLQGRAAVIPPEEFTFWAKKATVCLNRNKVELATVPPYLGCCCCEVAEALFVHAEQEFLAMLPTERVGSYSRGRAALPVNGQSIEATIQRVAVSWLAGTPLHNLFVFSGGVG